MSARQDLAAQVIPLFGGGDQRCQTLCDALLETIAERGHGLPLPVVLGVLRIVEHHLIASHLELVE
jgi:hypothetical protein